MTPEVISLIQACEWAPSQLLIFSDNVYAILIYYSHFGSIIPAILIAILVFISGRKELSKILLMITVIFFSIWVFGDLVLWAIEFPSYTMFFWTLIDIFEPFVYFFAFYFFYVHILERDFSFLQKIIFALPLVPTLIFAPTKLMLLGYDISNCDRAAVEGVLATYGYAIEILYTLFIVGFAVYAWKIAKDAISRRRIFLLTLGIVFFLASFSAGNILEVFSLDWGVGQYGLFGAPVFVGFLAYLIVRYKAFNVRLIGAQVLVAGLGLSVLSLLFIRTIEVVRVITGFTLVFVLVAGYLMVRGVYKEIAQREHIEKLAKDLEVINERQEALMHFVGHEVKGFLTRDAAVFASLYEGDFGQLPEALKPITHQALEQSRDGALSVTNILMASNQKKGTVSYTKAPFDLKAIVASAVEKLKQLAEQKGLEITFSADDAGVPYTFNGDKEKIENNVLRNIIGNSVNYTQSGSINVTLKKENNHSNELGAGKFVISVKDTGIGITEEDKKRLFTEGGHGKDSQKVNVHSTGYGLFIAKSVVEAQGGTILAESEGEGKGSTFIVELPVL